MKKSSSLLLFVLLFLPGLAASADLPYYLGSHALRMTAHQEGGGKSSYLATSLIAGKYFHDSFALEARYGSAPHEQGKHPIAGYEETPGSFLATFLRVDWAFNERLLCLGLAGYNWQKVRTTNAGARSEEIQGDFAFGMGFEYRLTPHIAMQAEYLQYLSTPEVEFTAFDGGVLFRF